MPVVSSTHVSIAWFKLAECVRRGEKERALSVYKLLVHSLRDEAVAMQLKGDIYAIFNMPTQAVQAYQEAARLFERAGRKFQAVYAHECVVAHEPRCYHSFYVLVAWYASIGVHSRAYVVARYLIQALIEAGYISRAYEALQECTSSFSQEQIAHLYEIFIQNALKHQHGSADRTIIHTGIAKAIDVYRDTHNDEAISTFVDVLSNIDEQASLYAQEYYQENG